jgi:hypothetical protein
VNRKGDRWRDRGKEDIPVGERVPASERARQRIEALLPNGVEDGDVRSELVRLGVRKLVEEALQGEVEDDLGRATSGAAATKSGAATETAPARRVFGEPRGTCRTRYRR